LAFFGLDLFEISVNGALRVGIAEGDANRIDRWMFALHEQGTARFLDLGPIDAAELSRPDRLVSPFETRWPYVRVSIWCSVRPETQDAGLRIEIRDFRHIWL